MFFSKERTPLTPQNSYNPLSPWPSHMCLQHLPFPTPYNADGKSLLPPTNISSIVIEAGEAAKFRRHGRLSARSLPTVALVNETLICEVAPNVKVVKPSSHEKNISIAFTQIPKIVRVLRRLCAVHRIAVAPIVTLLWNDTPPRTDSPDSVAAISEEKSLPTAHEFTQPTEVEPAIDQSGAEKSQYGEDSVEARLSRHEIVCPRGWRPDLVDPEPAYPYIQYVKPLPTIMEKESCPAPKFRHIGPSHEELIGKCDALAERVKTVFPVDNTPFPSTSRPPIPPRPEWTTPAFQFRPATFAPPQSLNGPAGIGPTEV